MARPVVHVRDATPDDLPDLMVLWQELRELGGRQERSVPAPTAEGVLARLHQSQQDPNVRIVVATADGEVVGVMVLTHQPFATLFDTTAAQIHYLHVRAGHRRCGVGQALLAEAAAFAESVGADHVMTSVYPHLRDTQRFYARLGFSPLVVRRVAALPVLRRRLAVARGIEMIGKRRAVRTRSRVRQALLSN